MDKQQLTRRFYNRATTINANKFRSLLLFFLSLCSGTTALAGNAVCNPDTDLCAAIGKWNLGVALGVGKRQNPVEGRDDIPLYVVPQISYYGERFFLENLDFGFTFYDTPSSSLSLLATPGYDRAFFYENDPQNIFVDLSLGGSFSGNPAVVGDPNNPNSNPDPDAPDVQDIVQDFIEERERKFTYMSGIEWTAAYKGTQFQFDLLQEITGRHGGQEVRVAVGVPMVRRQWSLSLTVGVTWKSSETLTYYYGAPDIFELDSSISPFVKLGYHQNINARWSILAFVHYQQFGDEMMESPIIKDDNIITSFLGGIYSF